MSAATHHELTLHEEILLIALHDERGSGGADVALGGALLAELLLAGLVTVDRNERHPVVTASSGARDPDLDPLLAECLDDIAGAKKPRKAERWVLEFSQKKHLKARVAAPLVGRGVLREQKRTFLFIGRTTYPELDPAPEAELTERMRSAIEHDHVVADDRTALVIAIANRAGILTRNIDRSLLWSRRSRLKELRREPVIDDAVNSAMAAYIS